MARHILVVLPRVIVRVHRSILGRMWPSLWGALSLGFVDEVPHFSYSGNSNNKEVRVILGEYRNCLLFGSGTATLIVIVKGTLF